MRFVILWRLQKSWNSDGTYEDMRRWSKESALEKIIANVMNLKVDVIESEEGPGYGAAILAAVGCGAFENVERAVEKLVHVVETVEPDAELVEKYEQRYQKFKKYYPALRGLF